MHNKATEERPFRKYIVYGIVVTLPLEIIKCEECA